MVHGDVVELCGGETDGLERGHAGTGLDKDFAKSTGCGCRGCGGGSGSGGNSGGNGRDEDGEARHVWWLVARLGR